MADYRDLAAALSGGYGQDTGPITADTLITLKNGKTASAGDLLGMLKGYGQSVGSNLESLVRGGVASVPGMGGDLESLGRAAINKLYSAGGVNVNPNPVLPTSTDILGMMPRITAPRRETAGMEELGGFMTPATAKVLTPAVKGAARLAGQEINAGLTGQPTRSLLGDITPKPKLLDVYHGTPHTLPPTERNLLGEFDASKIGTGEGAQSYGYGIYTAENPVVAGSYKLAGVDTVNLMGKDGNSINISALSKPLQKAIEANVGAPDLLGNAERFLANKTNQSFYSEKYGAQSIDDSVKALKDLNAAGVSVKNSGNLYKVDLPDEKIATMLDWDAPLSKQPKTIQNWLKDSMNPYRAQLGAKDIGGNEPTGSLIYNRLTELMSEGKKSDVFTNAANYGTKNASQELADAGIAGIKYLDEGSRAAGQGTRNFVVFPGEEKSMTILERNAEKNAK